MLVDSAIIEVQSGKGGDGRVAFRKEKYINKGGPNGGDGGNGGNVYLVATPGVDTLLDFSGRHHWAAQEGDPGGPKQKHGANGEHLYIQIPPGTLVYNNDTGELIIDMSTPNQSIIIAQGGRGGFGNEHFKTSIHQTPTTASPGEPSQSVSLRFELKIIADIGLIGLPNAGKSTLLARITKAHPRIASYPFTTLEPNLGIVEFSGERRVVVADIPGLIEGAHTGKGLGIAFLRHVERTKLLVHLLELEPADGSDPVHNYNVIRNELAGYSPALAEKPQIICLSKMDLLPGEHDTQTAIDLIKNELNVPVLAISSANGDGVPALLELCWTRLKEYQAQQDKIDAAEALRKAADEAAAAEAEEASAQASDSSGNQTVA